MIQPYTYISISIILLYIQYLAVFGPFRETKYNKFYSLTSNKRNSELSMRFVQQLTRKKYFISYIFSSKDGHLVIENVLMWHFPIFRGLSCGNKHYCV